MMWWKKKQSESEQAKKPVQEVCSFIHSFFSFYPSDLLRQNVADYAAVGSAGCHWACRF